MESHVMAFENSFKKDVFSTILDPSRSVKKHKRSLSTRAELTEGNSDSSLNTSFSKTKTKYGSELSDNYKNRTRRHRSTEDYDPSCGTENTIDSVALCSDVNFGSSTTPRKKKKKRNKSNVTTETKDYETAKKKKNRTRKAAETRNDEYDESIVKTEEVDSPGKLNETETSNGDDDSVYPSKRQEAIRGLKELRTKVQLRVARTPLTDSDNSCTNSSNNNEINVKCEQTENELNEWTSQDFFSQSPVVEQHSIVDSSESTTNYHVESTAEDSMDGDQPTEDNMDDDQLTENNTDDDQLTENNTDDDQPTENKSFDNLDIVLDGIPLLHNRTLAKPIPEDIRRYEAKGICVKQGMWSLEESKHYSVSTKLTENQSVVLSASSSNDANVSVLSTYSNQLTVAPAFCNVGSRVEVKVVDFQTPADFWVKILGQDALRDLVMSLYFDVSDAAKLVKNLSIGLHCCVRDDAEDQWFRAEVKRINYNSEDKSLIENVEVRYLDVGTLNVVSPDKLWSICKQCAAFPATAVHCKLVFPFDNVQCSSDDISNFHNWIHENVLQMTLVDFTSDGLAVVELEEGTKLNDMRYEYHSTPERIGSQQYTIPSLSITQLSPILSVAENFENRDSYHQSDITNQDSSGNWWFPTLEILIQEGHFGMDALQTSEELREMDREISKNVKEEFKDLLDSDDSAFSFD